ncbi:MAG TPA: CoA pyrophosphatase [Burkholderiaceae bacterium]|mgnify:CR=1 FL=1|nr:CoA pyrophosphatase [Burkholderiaceae bacterium]
MKSVDAGSGVEQGNSVWTQLPRFDPREMPIAATDESLPAVHPERLDPDALRSRFARPPAWEPEQTDDRFRIDQSDPRDAAVLVPIVAHAAGTTVLLTQRTLHLRHHSGQVAFPGGRVEAGDPSPVDAALREAHEEVGLAPSRVEVIGRLPEYLTGTGFRVTPVVGLILPGFEPRPDPTEVAQVFEVPLAFLMDPRHHQRRSVRMDAGERLFFAMPYRAPGAVDEHFIWGATAAMLRNLYRLLVA